MDNTLDKPIDATPVLQRPDVVEKTPRSFSAHLGGWLSGLIGVSGYIFLYVPILLLVIFSFNDSRYGQTWEGFSLRWYVELFQDEAIGRALWATLLVAVVSTLIATVLGTMVAIGMERFRFRGQTAVETLLYLPIVIPDIVMALMMLLFFTMLQGWLGDWFRLGPVTVIIAHVAFNISYVTVVVRARMASYDNTLEEAAADLYASPWRTFWRVTFPILAPAIVAGALLAFTLSLDDAVITSFVTGPGFTTLPVRILGQAKRGITPLINALSTMMLLVSMVLLTLSLWSQRDTAKRGDLV